MTVRGEIAEPRCETSARSPEDPMRTRAVRGGFEGRARWPKARRSSGSAIAAEVFMNNGGGDNLYRLRAGDYRVVFKRSGTRIDIVRVLSKPDFQKAY